MTRDKWVLALLLVSAGCKTAGQGSTQPEVEPKTSAVVPMPQADQAQTDFQAEAKQIEGEAKNGAYDWEAVKDRMESLTQKHSRYGLAFYDLGVALERLGKTADAEKAYRQAIERNGSLRAAYENLAAILARRGEHREAESLLRDISARDPGASGARAALAAATLQRGDTDEAVRLAQEALGRDPKNVEAYCVLARAAVEQKDYQRTRLVVAQGRKINEAAACFHLVLARVLLAEKQTAQALVAFEKAVEADPTLIEARFRIAEISLGFKDFRKAIANYDAAAKIDDKNAAAWVNMGVAFKGSARFDEAEKAYLKAIEVAANEPVPEAHFNLGVLYLRNMNRLDDAKTQLKRYLQIGSASSDDPAFGMLEEIDQLKAAEVESKRMEEEAKKQEEIDKKAAEEEAKRQAEEQKLQDEDKKREQKIDEKAKQKGGEEPADPGATPGIPRDKSK